MVYLIIIIFIVIILMYFRIDELNNQIKKTNTDKDYANERLHNLQIQVSSIINSKNELYKKYDDLEIEKRKLADLRADLDTLATQRAKAFPLLGEVYKEYFEIKGKLVEDYLRNKRRSAPVSADVVKKVTLEKRELIAKLKIAEYKIKNYEILAPFLTEVEEQITAEDDSWLLRDYSEEELQDETIRFLTKEEYRALSTSDRNQLALDRYWTKSHKSLWTIGKMYEHYVGYLYEQKGWTVQYFGIAERYIDFGRDLIATKGKTCHIIQCKNWSKYKTIYENHIFQLFGTTFEYQQSHPNLSVTAVFYTTTKLSDAAQEFAKRLQLEIHDGFKLERYPCIKCNISNTDKTKIYHLPFDQKYDETIIEPKKQEFYCLTVKEAEAKGFRRAFRWHSEKKS